MSKRIPAVLLLIVFIVVAMGVNTPLAKANPIAITQAPTGGLFSSNQTLQLREAHVEILIQPQRINDTTFHQDVVIYGNYSIFSPTSVNTTIAFAYPTIWDYPYYGSTPDVRYRELFLRVNGTSVEYQTLEFDDLFIGHSLDLEREYDWIQDEGPQLTFASFNTTTLANTTLFLEVNGMIGSTVRTDVYEFSYCVGTGRTWSGHARETVQIKIENYTQYLNTNFIPYESLSISTFDDSIIGYWDLNLTEFEQNYVSVQCTHYSWGIISPPPPPSSAVVVWIVAVTVVSVVAVFLVWRSRH